jgi:N,N'-diacetyllegionaminate synthase
MSDAPFAIAGRAIDGAHPPYVVAEAGVNHNGDPFLARRLVEAAAQSGADAVKFQTFRAESLATAGAERASYQLAAGEGSQLEMLRGLELPNDVWADLSGQSERAGITFLSTPFDVSSVELLGRLPVPAFKIGSGDLTNALLLRAVGIHGRPVILSTGMGDLADVGAALDVLRTAGSGPVALLHCASIYPADEADANLRAIDTLRERFGDPVGFSDHTRGLTAAVAATARGASIIEKHLTLDRSMAGPDHAASLEPGDFRSMVLQVRAAWTALGDGRKEPRPAERETMRVARRSLVTARSLEAGHRLIIDDLDAKRPGTGISPMRVDAVVGRRLARPLQADHLLEPADLDPPLEAGG